MIKIGYIYSTWYDKVVTRLKLKYVYDNPLAAIEEVERRSGTILTALRKKYSVGVGVK